MARSNGGKTEKRGFEKRRESELFLSRLNSILSTMIDYQEGKITNGESIILSLREIKHTLGRRKEDFSLQSAILARSEKIALNLIRE